MTPQDLKNEIASTPFLSGLSECHVRLIAECSCRTQFNEGEVIFQQSETANRFYLIQRGTVQLEAVSGSGGRRVVAGSIGPGGVLGWSWLFEPYQWQFTARSVTETSAIFFYGTVLREHCETDPSLGYELFKRMSAEIIKSLQSARKRLLATQESFSEVGAQHALHS